MINSLKGVADVPEFDRLRNAGLHLVMVDRNALAKEMIDGKYAPKWISISAE